MGRKPAPVLAVSPSAISVEVVVGQNALTPAIQVRNLGTGALKWRVSVLSDGWLAVSPTQGTNSGTLTVMVTTATLPLGVVTGSVQVSSNGGTLTVPVQVTMGAAAPAPPPPSAPSLYGPQPLTCPAGSVDVWPTSDLRALVNSYPEGTTFCLRAGIHALTGSVRPKSGMTWVGECGTVQNGQVWVDRDGVRAAFPSHTDEDET